MSNIIDVKDDEDIMDVARRWYLRLEDEGSDDSVMAEFEHWTNEDASHLEAFHSVVDFWARIEAMPEIKEIQKTGGMVVEPETFSNNKGGEVVELIQKPQKRSGNFRMKKWRVWSIAAALLLVVTMTLNFYMNYVPEGTYRTATGEQKTIELADGSTVFLNTASIFKVEFNDANRRVHLMEGEARFDVAKDSNRPFIVETSKGSVRAIGTSFNIYDTNETVEVIVFEGTVAVEHPGHKLEQVVDKDVLVNGGERIIAFDNNLSVVRAAFDYELSQKKAWTAGKIIFKGQKLSEVIKELSRYSNKKIVIADEAVNDMKLGGAFDIEDFEALLHAIEDTFPVRIVRFTPFVTIIIEA